MSYRLDKWKKGERPTAEKMNRYRDQVLANKSFDMGSSAPNGHLPPKVRETSYAASTDLPYQFQVIKNPADATQFAVRGGIWNIINSGQTHYADAATTAADITGSIFGMDTLTDNGGAGKLPADLYTDASMSLISSTTYYVFLIANSSTQYGGVSDYNTYSIFYSVYRPPLDSPDFDDYNPESIKVLAKVDTDADGVLTITQEWRGGNPKTNVDVLDSVDDLTDDDSDWDMQTHGYNDRGCKEIYNAKTTLADTQQNQDKKALYFDVDENAGVAGEVTTRYAWPVTADLAGSPRPFNDYDDPSTFANPQVASITDAGASGSYAYMTVNSRTFTVSDATLDIGALDGGAVVNIAIGNVDSSDITYDVPYNHVDLGDTPDTGTLQEHDGSYLRFYDTTADSTYINDGETRNKAGMYAGILGLCDTGTGDPDVTNVWDETNFLVEVDAYISMASGTYTTIDATTDATLSSSTGDVNITASSVDVNISAEYSVNYFATYGAHSFQTGRIVVSNTSEATATTASIETEGGVTAKDGGWFIKGDNVGQAGYFSDETYAIKVGDGTDVIDVDGVKYSPMTVDVVIGGITKTINILGSLV